MRLLMRSTAIGAMLLATAGCTGFPQLLGGAPPTAPILNSTRIDETAIDTIRDLFDVALFGVDALPLVPRSPEAVRVAGIIRTIARLLGAADAAQKAGSAATYDEALRQAREAIRQLRGAIGMPPSTSAQLRAAPQVQAFAARMTDVDRLAIADRLDPSNHGGTVALR